MSSYKHYANPRFVATCGLCFASGFILSAALFNAGTPEKGASLSTETAGSPAYLIGAATITDFDRLPQYRQIAEPLAERQGYRIIASGTVNGAGAVLLEGEWPAQGLWFIERYESISGLLAFTGSKEYQDAKKLRDAVADVHFMIAIEGGERGTSSE